MKRPALALVFAVALALAALALREAVAPDRLRADVERTLAAWTGRALSLTGTASFEILPRPHVRWTGVALTAPDLGAIGTAEEVRVTLSLADLLRARIRPAGVTLTAPRLTLAALPLPALGDVEARLRAVPPLRLAVTDGRVRLPGDGDTAAIEGLALDLDWPSGDRRAALEAKLAWRGLPVRLEIQGPTPSELAAEEPTRLAGEFGIAGSAMGFRGTVRAGPARHVRGEISLALSSPSDLLRRLGYPDLAGYLAADTVLVGDLAAGGDAATLTLTRAELGDTALKGALSLRWSGETPLLAATLAADTLDLRDVHPPHFGPAWADLPLDRVGADATIDLRVSVGRLFTRTLRLDGLAASLHLGEGRLNAELGEATLWGGRLSLLGRGELDAEGLRLGLRGEARALPLREVARFLGAEGVEEGSANATFTAETRCARPRDCPAGLDGRLAVAVRDAALMGVSPFADVSRFHPVALAAPSAPKKTRWPRADLDAHVLGTGLTIDSLTMVGDLAALSLAGSADLLGGRVDLAGRATFPSIRLDPDRNSTGALTVPLRIQGPIDRLEVAPGTAPAPPAEGGVSTPISAEGGVSTPTTAEGAPSAPSNGAPEN